MWTSKGELSCTLSILYGKKHCVWKASRVEAQVKEEGAAARPFEI